MKPLLEIKNLKAYFHTRRGIVKAVDGLSFHVDPGETLGIVGESGSGKSVLQLSYMKLLPTPPLKIESGQAIFDGRDLLTMDPHSLRDLRGNQITMIFQEPMTSLNPYMKIGNQLIEPLVLHLKMSKQKAWQEAIAAMKRVGIAEAESAMNSYPHEFSGGMRQRVMIAMALTTKPKLLIADEPTTALDVTVQAQILDLLRELQKETGMSIILITHDLGVVAGLAHRVIVMYAGHIMEQGTADDLFYRAQNPYTHGLLKSTPRLDIPQGMLPTIGGTPPDLTRLGAGCPFYERCSYHMDICTSVFPPGRTIAPEHESYCYLETRPS